MVNKLVSIITPFYNADKYIKKAIQSVINQSYENWELLLINDGSEDSSVHIVKSFLVDSRIKLLEQSNQGVSSARNLGLRNMKGNFFCFLDADDILTPNSIEARLKVILNEKVEVADGSVEVMNSDLSKLQTKYRPSFNGKPIHELIQLTGNCFLGQTWLFKKKQNIEFFREDITHSEELLFMIENYGNSQYSYTSEVILKYRTGHSSAMSNLKGLEQGYKRVFEVLNDKGLGNEYDRIVMKARIKKYMTLDYVKRFNLVGVVRMLFW